MIYLSGAINLVNQAELQREAEFYARNGWELKDPTTHKVSVTIAAEDIDAFCQYLRSRPTDKRLKVWTDRNGEQHQAQTVTFFLNGSEMTGSWTRLRARIDPNATPTNPQGSAGAAAQRQSRTAPPVRRSPHSQAPANGLPQHSAPAQAPQAPAAPLWNSQPINANDEDDDIPF